MAGRSDLLALMRRHVGRENAITKSALAKQLRFTTRKIENDIRDLILLDGINIASACDRLPFGYFIIDNQEEASRYRAQLISRIRKLNERLMAVDENTARKIQRELFL